MSTIDAVENLLKDVILLPKLKIPDYQRPYTWKQKNVVQLLEDIRNSINIRQKKYRIGTIILHQEKNGELAIVDGQQRLTTISIILYHLGYKDIELLKNRFSHEESQTNISINYSLIREWFINIDINEKEELKRYILDQCDFVVIKLNDLSEAFQFFDSQNSRGRELNPSDLLKAFHLREMQNNTQSEKLSCVLNWEASPNLNSLIGTYLFRIRKWTQGEDAGLFGKNDIDEFKGINFNMHQDYPYLKPYKLNDAMIAQLFYDPIWKKLGPIQHYPFQITQVIINGKLFFEMISHYSALFHQLFDGSYSESFQTFYNNQKDYNGCGRTGDKYVKRLFKATILLYYDRFGSNEFDQTYKLLYMWAYKIRLEKYSVRYNTADNYILTRGNNNFKTTNYTDFPRDLQSLKQKLVIKDVDLKHTIEKILDVFDQQKLLIKKDN